VKVTAQEEYGLRILIRIASCKDGEGLSVPQIAEAEGLTNHYTAKLTRELRLAGFVRSTPGNKGGYSLAKPANEIVIKNVLNELGGNLFDISFCNDHSGTMRFCTNSVDCSVRSLWSIVQLTMDKLLLQITLADLIDQSEQIASKKFEQLLKRNPEK
jgi:Rrf2 family protein